MYASGYKRLSKEKVPIHAHYLYMCNKHLREKLHVYLSCLLCGLKGCSTFQTLSQYSKCIFRQYDTLPVIINI